jgi:DNA-binding SARP family transcriptional activator/tetratricopeptide (TPR) repeat protein
MVPILSPRPLNSQRRRQVNAGRGKSPAVHATFDTLEAHPQNLNSMWRLLTFGGLALKSDDGSPPPRLRPQRLAILAVLAASDRGVSRERLLGIFWPEADEERARGSLRQAFYALRQELGADVVQGDALFSLDDSQLTSDVAEFRAALAGGHRARAAALATGSFLNGFFLPGVAGFERWVEEERAALAADAMRVVLALARGAEDRGERDVAADWWRRLTLLDPLSGRFALGYLKALAAAGDRPGALAFARAHESVVRRELEADPDPEIRRLEEELRALPSPPVARAARAPGAASGVTPAGGSTADERPAPDVGRIFASGPPPRAFEMRRVRIGAAAALGAVALVGVVTANKWRALLGMETGPSPTFAVGMIREEGVPDTLRIGGVLTDMLATNLARVTGLSVLANTRLFELMNPGEDTLPVGYYEAARRAGATEIFQGRLLAAPQWSLGLEIQRVELATGVVRSAYRVNANDRYALIDSMTSAIARDLRLRSPPGSITEATTGSPIAYRLYEEGLRALYHYDQAAGRRLMAAAVEEDSTFAMAAYYDLILSDGDAISQEVKHTRAMRLAARLPERERLIMTVELLQRTVEPAAMAVAESLSLKYPGEPQSYEQLSKVYFSRGDWAEARNAIERAIAIDSASEPVDRQACRLCEDLNTLASIYFWWDSLPAAERTAERLLRLRPRNHAPWHIRITAASLREDSAATHANLRRFQETNATSVSTGYLVRRLILTGEYDTVERQLETMLDSPRPDEVSEARWFKFLLLRQQGRLTEARRMGSGTAEDFPGAILALEQGDHRAAAATFGTRAGWSFPEWAPGVAARHRTWNKTLFAMVLAAMGDTLRMRRLADTVEYWGQRSNYGRDRRAHHYIRGMLLVAEKRDAEAATELREAIHSPTNGFTRVNYELGRTLLRLGRPAEAVPIVRAALHGELDGSSLYQSRTELHELLALVFDRLGQRDSAAVHYRAVARAWKDADPVFHVRRDQARAWLARHAPATVRTATR